MDGPSAALAIRLTGSATSCSLSSPSYWAVELSGPDKYEKQRVLGTITGSALVGCDGRVSIVALAGTSNLLRPTRYRIGDEEPQAASGMGQAQRVTSDPPLFLALFTDQSMERVAGKPLAFEAGNWDTELLVAIRRSIPDRDQPAQGCLHRNRVAGRKTPVAIVRRPRN